MNSIRPIEASAGKKKLIKVTKDVPFIPLTSVLVNIDVPEGVSQTGLQNNLSKPASLLDTPIAKASRQNKMPGNLQLAVGLSSLYGKSSGAGT